MFNPIEYAIVALTGMICFILATYESGMFVLDLNKGVRRNYHLGISGGLTSGWVIAIALLVLGVPGFYAVATAVICGGIVFFISNAMLTYAT